MSPDTLLRMLSPFFPTPLSMNDDSNKMIPTLTTARRSAAHPRAFRNGSDISAPRTSRVPIVAGPTIIGIAKGTTAISSSGDGFDVAGLAWTIPTADKNSRAPAPTRKESNVIPNSEKITLPKRKSSKQEMPTAPLTRRVKVRR